MSSSFLSAASERSAASGAAAPRLGILAAMPEEIAKLKEFVTEQEVHKRGAVFEFVTGKLDGRPVVFGASGIGMVFASSAATTMICEFGASRIVFTGVAGGLKTTQKVGDLVVGSDVVNYEMDARNFTIPWEPDHKIQLGEIPIMKWRFYEADATMLALAMEAPVPEGVRRVQGRLASGSIFLDVAAKKGMAESVWAPLDYPEAAEMENAAVAQICKAYNIPYVSLRALSDVLEGDANEDFGKFCRMAADNVFPIVRFLAEKLPA